MCARTSIHGLDNKQHRSELLLDTPYAEAIAVQGVNWNWLMRKEVRIEGTSTENLQKKKVSKTFIQVKNEMLKG
jgi:hypothetical protein